MNLETSKHRINAASLPVNAHTDTVALAGNLLGFCVGIYVLTGLQRSGAADGTDSGFSQKFISVLFEVGSQDQTRILS